MTRLRLIYLSNARLPTEKAHGYQIMKMCQAFANLGLSVTLLHPHRLQVNEALYERDPFEYYGVDRLFETVQLSSWDWRFLMDKLGASRIWFLVQSLSYAVNACRYTARWWRDPQVLLYSRDRLSQFFLLLCRPFIRAKLVFEAHVFPGYSRTWLIPLFKHRLDLLVVVTQQLERLFAEAGVPEGKIIVAPDAVDLEQFQIPDARQECRRRLGLPLERPIVGYVGRFRTMGMEKGIPELIEAMKYLLRACTPPPLLLCVGGPMESVPTYKALARQHGVPLDHLRFLDRVPNTEVPYWLRGCDVLTIPLPWSEHMAYYTSPMKLFEYMAAGVPTVASNLPSLCEVLEQDRNAMLVSPGNPRSLAEGIQRVLDDQELAQRLSAQAFEDVQSYTWDKRARRILDSIEKTGRVDQTVRI
jgi:glycosyltransferase involved in cell wall biosynthesis